MKILILHKGSFNALPNVMSLALVVKELGHEIEVVTSFCEEETKQSFAENGIEITDICTEHDCLSSNIFCKAKHWSNFSKRAWKLIDGKKQDALLWVGTADTALALGKRLLRQHYVLQIQELYDKHPIYRRGLAKYARRASCVVVPEICRAAIFRSWYGLKQTPVVLPNKPADHPRQKNLRIDNENAKAALTTLKAKDKIVLYQGHIAYDRDIRPVAESVRNVGNGWTFVAMGLPHGDYLHNLRRSCPNLIYIPHVMAPYHLQITSHAFVGVVTYPWDTLNNLFCAPNKVWEYSGFGIPMICSDLPALQFSVQTNNAGICTNMADRGQIESALRELDLDYARFSKAACQLYESIDLRSIIQGVIKKAAR